MQDIIHHHPVHNWLSSIRQEKRNKRYGIRKHHLLSTYPPSSFRILNFEPRICESEEDGSQDVERRKEEI